MPLRQFTITLFLVFAIFISQTTFVTASSEHVSSHRLVVTKDQRKLTAKIEHVPLQDVLQDLANRLSINVSLLGFDGPHRVSTSFTELPIEQGIERLLQGQDYALLYTGPSSSHIKEIIVLSRQNTANHSSSTRTAEVRLTKRKSKIGTEKPEQLQDQAIETRGQVLNELASKLDNLVQISEHDPIQRVSRLTQATKDPHPQVRALAKALLEQSGDPAP